MVAIDQLKMIVLGGGLMKIKLETQERLFEAGLIQIG